MTSGSWLLLGLTGGENSNESNKLSNRSAKKLQAACNSMAIDAGYLPHEVDHDLSSRFLAGHFGEGCNLATAAGGRKLRAS